MKVDDGEGERLLVGLMSKNEVSEAPEGKA
jgi:hypothetical protein